ncbi:MAG: MFS transporter [Actinobacteria bacterium]|nr:MFS transporter [Actinomycetota bacterium]
MDLERPADTEAVKKQAAGVEAAEPKVSRRAILAMVTLCVAVFIAALDQTMVLTVMPSIMDSLYIDVAHLTDVGWIITGYLLGYTIAMPLFGRLADVRGRRPMAMVALTLFMLGSALCVFLDDLGLFVAARVVQAAGGGALVPIAMAAAADMFPLRRRALVLGIIGGAAEAGGVLGPMYGAGLASLWSWRLIFLVNIPLCVMLMPICWRLLRPGLSYAAQPGLVTEGDLVDDDAPPSLGGGRARWWQRGRVDYLGACLMALALAGVTIGLGTGTQTVDASAAGSATVVKWPWLVVSGVAFIAFVLYERRHEQPLIRLDFFKRPAFAAANIAHMLVGAALIIGMVEIPLYAYTLFGMTEIEGGLLLIRLTLMIPVGAVLGGWLADFVGYRVTAVLGFLVAAGGYLLVSRWPLEPTQMQLTRDLMVSGLGFGLVIGPIGAGVISSVGPKWMTTSSALVTVSRMVGMVVGLSTLSSWGVRRFNVLAADISTPIVRPPDLTDAEWQAVKDAAALATKQAAHSVFGEFFLIAAVIIAVAVIPAIFFYKHKGRGTARIPFLPH